MPANHASREAAQLAITRRQGEHDHTVMPVVLKYLKSHPRATMTDVCNHLYIESVPTPRNFGLNADLLEQPIHKWSDRILRRIIERCGLKYRRGWNPWTIPQDATDRFV